MARWFTADASDFVALGATVARARWLATEQMQVVDASD